MLCSFINEMAASRWMLLTLGTGNGERRTGNGERGTGNGERGTGNGERGTGNGEPGTGVWERVYSGNPLENSEFRMAGKTKEKDPRIKRKNNLKREFLQAVHTDDSTFLL